MTVQDLEMSTRSDPSDQEFRHPPARRPKLLFLSQSLPFPPDGGVEIRVYNIMRLLSREFDVTALCFYRKASRATEEVVRKAVEGLSRIAEVEAFPIPQEHSRPRMAWDHFRSATTRKVYTRYSYESKEYRRRVREVMRERRFDMVHMDSLDLAAYLPEVGGVPIVCTHHNVESALLRRRAAAENSWLARRYLELQSELMEKEERELCGSFELNVTVSEDDARQLSEMIPDTRFIVVPNGVDTKIFEPAPGNGEGLVFVGGYSWYPNREGMEFFTDKALPLIRKHEPDVRVTWVGRSPDEVARRYSQQGVNLTGYVENIRPYVNDASCFIVPLRVGGGSRLKILDAWAMGKAIVSTSLGCEGLDARDGENILIRDTPEGFAEAVLEVMRNAELREKLERNARRTAEEFYEWDVIGERFLGEYLSLAGFPSQEG